MKNTNYYEIEPDLLDTSVVSDALQAAGLPPGRLAGCRPLPGAGRICGRALPVLLGPWAGEGAGAHLGAGAIAAAGGGDVLVLDNGGRADAACFGGLMALAATRAGIGGAVVHGAVRDLEEIRESGLPVYAAAASPASARGRFVELASGGAVTVGSTLVRAGDRIVADASGVVVIPGGRLQEVLALARDIRRRESDLAARLGRGEAAARVLDARYETLLAEVDRAAPAAPPLHSFSTCTISDALDLLGLQGQCRDVVPRTACGPASGPAFTVRYEAVGAGGEGTVGDYIDEVPAGSVVVIDNGGRTDCTVWGGLLSRAATGRGVAGTLIDGACRDLDEARRFGYAVFSRGVSMRSGKGRARLQSLREPVLLGGVPVDPGDRVLADEHGVVVVPERRLPAVVEAARRVSRAERSILSALGAGEALASARLRAGYHALRRSP